MNTLLSFFQKGTQNSSSRLFGALIIVNALLLTDFVILFVFLTQDKPDITPLLLASGGMFVQIAGPAMYFLFKQKKTEVQEIKE
jgi:hypothetical protein